MIPSHNTGLEKIIKLELKISCNDLQNKDVVSKSDPQVFVVLNLNEENEILLGQTERIKNNLNPTFTTPIQLDYKFGTKQILHFIVQDIDGCHGGTVIGKNNRFNFSSDFLGCNHCDLNELMSRPGKRIKLPLLDIKQDNKTGGDILVVAEEIKQSNQTLKFKVSFKDLDKKDIIGKSDPYWILSKMSPNGWTKVYQSGVIPNTLNPKYDPVYIEYERLNSGDIDRELQFEVFDWDKVGKHELIGSFRTSTKKLITGDRFDFFVINPKKVGKSGYRSSGLCKLKQIQLINDASFLDYLNNGTQLNLIVGVDCSKSCASLSKQYANAIKSVGSVLAPFDSDGIITAFGFSAISTSCGRQNHLFPLGLTEDKLNLKGIDSVVSTYLDSISKITPEEPTYMAPLICKALQLANGCNQETQKYVVLLIITDGDIDDMDETLNAVRLASNYAISIVIVGISPVTSANSKTDRFRKMKILDADYTPLSNGGENLRDAVQFVTSDFLNQPDLLTQETLKEIPTQLISFMRKNNIKPNHKL